MPLDALTAGSGQTDQRDARHAIGGLLAVGGATALDVRTGVLHGPGSTTLLTGTTDTGPMTVAVGVHVAVTSRGTANGPYLGPTLEAAATVPIGAAPATGSRIDVVYVKQRDITSGVPSPDATPGPLYGVLAGTASSTPVKPDLSTVVGAVELGTVQVAAGATATNGAGVTITNTARQTVTRGAPIPVRTQAARDAITAAGGGYPGLTVRRLDQPGLPLEVFDGTGTTGVWYGTGYDSGWVNIPIASGFAGNGTPQVRRIGSLLSFRNGWTSSGMSATSAHTIGTLPVGLRPSSDSYVRAGVDTADGQGMFVIAVGGSIQVRTGASLRPYYRLDAVPNLPID